MEIKRKQLQETEKIRHNDQGIYIYFLWFNKELAHVIMKANKSQELQSKIASWRPRRVDGIQSTPSPKAWGLGVSSVI